jgi:hypothetical protein
MADQRSQTAKESKGLRNRLKKLFGRGSQSAPPSRRSNSHLAAPPAVVASPPAVVTPPAIVASPPAVVTPPAIVASPSAVVAPPALVASPLATVAAPPADLAPRATVSTMTTNPEEAAKLRAKYTHFRILVIGRANAGKTTLLKRVCNTKEDPVYSKARYMLRLILPHSYHSFTNRSTRPRR